MFPYVRQRLSALAFIGFVLTSMLAVASDAHAQVVTATITYPANGSTSANVTQPITWTTVPGAQAYYLYVGTTVGAKDLVDTGEILTTSFTASNLPNGQTLYVRLWTRVAGAWHYSDSTFASFIAVITTPASGATTANFTQPITWTSVPGVQTYYLYVGTAVGGKDLVDSGEIQRTSFTAANLPSGQTLYARLWTKVAGVWRYSDSSFASFVSVITTPPNGSTTANFTQPITWTSVPGAQAYYLYVGTTVGAKNLVDTGELQKTSFTASQLPSGQTLYARLWTKVGGAWRYTDSSFGAFVAVITSPLNNSTTANFAQPITWTPVPGAQTYYLYVGTTLGAKDLVNTGEVQQTSFPATKLPIGKTLYARLWTKMAGAWRYSDSSFASFTAMLTTPGNGSFTANFAQPITWTPVPGAQAYYLYIGTTPGARNLVDTGELQQTFFQAHLSTNQTLYARLWTKRNNSWTYVDSAFSSVAATLTYPSDGWATADPTRGFQWTSVPGAEAYYLYVGTSRGAKDVIDTGEVQTTSFIGSHIPTGQILYARMFTKVLGTWRFVDSTFSALPVEPTVQPSNLVYQGSFRVPHLSALELGGLGLDYGGTGLAYNPANNSLFVVGHDWTQLSTELAIPATLGTGTTVAWWPTADALQPLTDALEGHLADVAASSGDKSSKIGGQFVYNGQLYLTAYVYYGTSAARVIYRRSPSLQTSGSLVGGMALAPLWPDMYSGYMGLVPPEWQSVLGGPVLIGNCCLSIISRTSYGPAVSSIDLARLTPTATTTAAPLVYYPSDHPTLGNWGDPGINTTFNGTTMIRGVVFPAGTSSVLFFGRQGMGPYCYGEYPDCDDPAHPGKGDHAYPYAYRVWAYDAHDLAAVKAGYKEGWDVRPYAVWSLTLPNSGDGNGFIGGAAYDPASGRIFVSQQFGDGAYPVIHVFAVQ